MPNSGVSSLAVPPNEKGARALERIKERFQIAELPSSFSILSGSESGITDFYMNLNRQLADGHLAEKTKVLIAVAVAAAVGSPQATEFFSALALQKERTKQEILDAISVGGVCSIFNGYYRFRHQIPAELTATYEAFRAPFNANSFMKSALQTIEVEAICIAVSSINNCHVCVEGHLHKGKSVGLTDEQIDEIIKAGTIASATAMILASLSDTSNPLPLATT